MKIDARVPLKLSNNFYKIELKYDTYEKATYDQYLVASIIKNTKTKTQAFNYIDDITGKGSLNKHFKNLYEKISELSKEQIKGILKNSLYPQTVIDARHHIKYYPDLDISRFEGKVYHGNLSLQETIIKDLIMPKDEGCTFLSIKIEEGDAHIEENNYDCKIGDEEILVDIENGNYYSITKEGFKRSFTPEDINIAHYKGRVGNKIDHNQWYVLRNNVLNNFYNSNKSYVNDNGNLCIIENENVKEINVIKVFDLYFYSDTTIPYNRKNFDVCEKVLDYLIGTKFLNEQKTKSVLLLINGASDLKAQETVNYILKRKNSKEISDYGIKLIRNGLQKGWDKESLLSMKDATGPENLESLYLIDSDLNFTLDEIVQISNDVLTKTDLEKKMKYFEDKENILNGIKAMIGEMTTSGVRQNMKSLKTKDSVYKALNDFLINYVGHSRKDYEKLSLPALEKEHNIISNMYKNQYQKIKERIEKN